MKYQRHFVVQFSTKHSRKAASDFGHPAWQVGMALKTSPALKIERPYFNVKRSADAYVKSLRILYKQSGNHMGYRFRVIELVEF